jgi:hypothetical protein
MNWRASLPVVKGMADLYPNIGFDPCPGDLTGYQALAAYASRSAATLTDAQRTLASAGSEQWRGQTADAFRAHVHTDVLPLASKAVTSISQAALALHDWARTLAALQDEARALDRQAAPYQTQLAAALRSAGLSSTAQLPYAAKLKPAQQAQIDAASTALAGITSRASQIHAEYLAAVQRTAGQLQNAGNMAPRPPGFFSQMWHDATTGWDDIVRGANNLVHNKALWEFVSGVANIVATVAGLLALFPPLSLIFAPIALGAAGVALLADGVLAIFDRNGWAPLFLDAGAVVTGFGWMKAAGKLTEIFKEAGLTGVMTKAPTWAGLVSKVPLVMKIPVVGSAIDGAEKTVEVAPGMFRMIAGSLKAAAGDTRALDAMTEVKAAVKEFEGFGAWRAVDVQCGMFNWSFSGGGIEALPGTVRNWVNNVATGKDPWQEPADSTAV